MTDVTTKEYETLAVVANAVQLGTDVIHAVAGNEIANSIDGEPLEMGEISDTLAAKLNGYLMNPAKGDN